MKEVELPYRQNCPQAVLEEFCREECLVLSRTYELRTFRGCSHWHISHPNLRGVVEATWWPLKGRFWIKVAANREGKWIGDSIVKLAQRFSAE